MTQIPQDTNKEATQQLVKTNTDNLQPGQDVMANSIPVVIASDQSAIPVTLSVATLRTPSMVLVPASTGTTNTTSGVQEVSLKVQGSNAIIGGVAVSNGTVVTFRANFGDTVDSISYSTGVGTTILISYLV